MAKPITQVGPRLGILNTAVVYPVLNAQQVAVFNANGGVSDSNGWSSLLVARSGVGFSTLTTFNSVRPLVGGGAPVALMNLYESPDNATFGGVLNVLTAVTTGSRTPPNVIQDSVMTGTLYADNIIALSNSTGAGTPPASCCLLRNNSGVLQYQNVSGAWTPIGAAAAGSAGQIQFAGASGAFAGSPNFTWDNTAGLVVNNPVAITGVLSLTGNLGIAGTVTLAGNIQMQNYTIVATGFDPYVGGSFYTGQTYDVDFTTSGGFKIAGVSYNILHFKAGVLASAS